MAKTLAQGLLPVLDTTRSIGGLLGLRRFRIFLRVREWDGDRPGMTGSHVDNATNGGQDFEITVGQPPVGPQPVHAVFISNKEIMASGGQYRDRDMRIGPFTPPYTLSPQARNLIGFGSPHGGVADAQIEPKQYKNTAMQVFWRVEGDTMARGGSWFSKLEMSATALHYTMVLRANGTQPGP